ncbi:mini-chromosome maintenance complex-binding protein, putative [Babesia ovata]|uniref:Mini-chromosome maintenance complex-binding protein, putative n=1 Tax=Babesia ovata TaxID=189622 RepID=A0A2H6K9F6_9APIC|nr:mini-chromosome maintenance complex-binding protein, putative [Babesia ovata]GBE59627.1 mini-chromosome maintenance complex-binding protein, putative [Babesia ovata]
MPPVLATYSAVHIQTNISDRMKYLELTPATLSRVEVTGAYRKRRASGDEISFQLASRKTHIRHNFYLVKAPGE